jgi:hypothetical protein
VVKTEPRLSAALFRAGPDSGTRGQSQHQGERRCKMIELANDPTWFLYGLGVTVFLCVVMAVFVFFADRAQHR